MSEKETVADVAKRVQQKLRTPIVSKPNTFPILQKALKTTSLDVNTAVRGVAPSKRSKPNEVS